LEDTYRKLIEVDGTFTDVEIYDTGGAEQFTAMRDLYIQNSHGFALVYSITTASTFYALENYRDQIIRVKGTEDVSIVLIGKISFISLTYYFVGNKSDMNEARVLTTQQGQDLADKWGCKFFETSAKTRLNNTEMFAELVTDYQKRQAAAKPKKNKKSKKSKKCIIM
jgi:Ras-related protein Rap-1B